MILSSSRRVRRGALPRLFVLAVTLALAALVALNLLFFARHAVQVLAYSYPLDYGEGPLLSQVDLLRAGTSLHQLYGPLDQPPHLVVNYPPTYLLATLLARSFVGDTLLAGRLVSLASTLACVAALFILVCGVGGVMRQASGRSKKFHLALALVLSLAFLALPITREWAVLMRVDLLGVALGLWGIVALGVKIQASEVRGWASAFTLLLAALLLTASLYTKPSLVAAPVAVCAWLLITDWRRGLVLGGLLAALGGGLFVWLASGSHFFEHVVVANANTWQRDLAWDFWQGQFAIHGTLFLAAMIGIWAMGAAQRSPIADHHSHNRHANAAPLLPIIYTLAGVITAIGVGKVGAYLNYFLELYAGLIWLVGLALVGTTRTTKWPWRFVLMMLISLSLVRYYPTWSDTYLKQAGVIEGENPPRLVIGRRGVWQDLRRERQILTVQVRTNAMLVMEVQAAGAPILTDIPGLAAQAGQIPRLQAFEHSQMLQLWDQGDLRRDLANGQVPLVALDYLGNWLSPEVIALITHRYAQQTSLGGYDLYRPVEPGPRVATNLLFSEELRLQNFYLATNILHPGEMLVVTLELALAQASTNIAWSTNNVHLSLVDPMGHIVATDVRPLFYGALYPRDLAAGSAQHMQAVRLPATLAVGQYEVRVSLGEAEAQKLATIEVAAPDGALLENGWVEDGRSEYVPAPLLTFWQAHGGGARFGMPITPAVPFAVFTQQCFERGCLRAHAGEVEQVTLGVALALGDLGANNALDNPQLGEAFRPFYEQPGGVAGLGEVVTNEFRSGGRIVQYTEFARLERPVDGGIASLGNIGEDALRLPGGVAYRWP